MEKQPAKINYFFKDGYIEFWHVIKRIFLRCKDVISDSWDKVCDHAGDFWDSVTDLPDDFFPALGHLFMMVFNFCKLLLNVIFAVPICILLSIFQALFLLFFMFVFYITFLIILFADRLYRSIKKISTSCPNCQEKFALPTFVCSCGAKHTYLIPSKYGTLIRKCSCGRKLKTTF